MMPAGRARRRRAAGQKKRVTRKAQRALANDLDPDDLVSLGLRGSNAGVETLLREDDEDEVSAAAAAAAAHIRSQLRRGSRGRFRSQ